MIATFKLEDLDCAACAAKMEADIARLPQVNSTSISFMTQKLTIDADCDDIDGILDKAQKICSSYEPDCTIVR